MGSNVPFTRIVRTTAAVIMILVLWDVSAALQSTANEPKFVSGTANITLTDDDFTGRTYTIVLTSPGRAYELALIQDGFGVDKKLQYCWAEVHDMATGSELTWRAPCNPFKVFACSLLLTSDGDFNLEVMNDAVPFLQFMSSTAGQGVVDVQLTDQGDLLLVKADNTTVWKSSDHISKEQECKEAFNPTSGSHRTSFALFSVACAIALSTIVALFS